MENMFCALGCSPTKNLFIFPSRKYHLNRRKVWLNFFGMEEPNTDKIFACERHFSKMQKTSKALRVGAVPDIPIVSDGAKFPLRRKMETWRNNVIVVTPKDPEFTIYRRETGVFSQKLFTVSDEPQMQVPMIKSVSCSMYTQTNTRLCGLVQISDAREEFSLNCFYCSEVFAIEEWSTFVSHLKRDHFEAEEAFKKTKYLPQDHDYTTLTPPSCSPVKSPFNLNTLTNSYAQVPPVLTQVLLQPILLPTLLAKPPNDIPKPSHTILKKNNTLSSPLLPSPELNNDETPFNISLADKLIKLLNATVLNPNFLHTEEDNILIIKNTGQNNIETSNFLTKIINTESSPVTFRKSQNPITPSSSPKHNTRPIYTINYGKRDVPSRRNSDDSLPPLIKHKMTRLVQRRIAQRTLKNINIFENIYKTVKERPLKGVASKIDLLEGFKSSKGTEYIKRNSYLTPISRFLKRTFTQTIMPEPKKAKSTEIVFEYAPADIVVLLLESMKNYPVLWEFHDQPYNKEFNKAIEELCQIINNKWSLNITPLKMRRSIIRILRFYRFMLPRESIDEFEEYYDKCALFLPSSMDAIPRARCAYCGICYKKDSDLRKHVIQQHKSLKWPYKCQHCWERFRERDEYELHKNLQHYEEIFKCEQCERRFNRRHFYNRHVSSHEQVKQRRMEATMECSQPANTLVVCDVCNIKFINNNELLRHKKKHEKIQKFKCHMCPNEYNSKMTLKFHLKRHRKEYSFICEVCGKGFIRKAYLETHMDTHTGAKVTCNICHIKLRKCSLSRHLRLVHVATEGNIEGTFRAKSYQYTKFLYPSEARKRGPEKGPRQYNCKICKTVFDRLKQLKDHNKLNHANVNRIPCKMCDVEFLYTSNLKRHYRFKHKLTLHQIFKLVIMNEDLSKVLTMKKEDLEAISELDFYTHTLNSGDNINKADKSLVQEMHSDKIQEEIMKAVENIDMQEIKVSNDHSMNDFFTDLF